MEHASLGMDVRMRARVYGAQGPEEIHFLLRVPDHAFHDVLPGITPEQLQEIINATLHDEPAQHAVPRASLDFLDKVAPRERYKHKTHGAAQCSVCLDTFTTRTNRYVRKLPCSHVFCARCIEKWVTTQSATCPTCRKPLHAQES